MEKKGIYTSLTLQCPETMRFGFTMAKTTLNIQQFNLAMTLKPEKTKHQLWAHNGKKNQGVS